MKRQLKFSFVIIEYFCLKDVCICANGISTNCPGNSYEIIISSNSGYSTEQQESVKASLPFAKWVFNKQNMGFAGGMNQGILHASGEIIILLNPDVIISHIDLRETYNYLMSNREIGLIGPKIIDRQGNLQDSYRVFLSPGELFIRIGKRFFLHKDVLLPTVGDPHSIQTVDWVIGAFMIARRDAIEKVGLLDEKYFMYVEDMDWCKRFWDCGFQVIYYPAIEVIYKGDRKSTYALISKKLINKYSLYHLMGYIRFLWKHRFHVIKN